MTEPIYALRLNRWSPERSYRQDDRALHWSSASGDGSLAFADIRRIRIYKFRYLRSRASYWRCDLTGADGQRVRLQAAHDDGSGQIEDRTEAYIPFVKRLEAQIAAANPDATVEQGRDWRGLLDRWRGQLFVLLLAGMRLVPLRLAQAVAAFLMRRVGPLLKGHRVARTNLTAAFPDKTTGDIDRILSGMWANVGRGFVEYAHLDRLWDYNPDNPGESRIVLDEGSRQRLADCMHQNSPLLLFGAHFGNWELLAWAIGRRRGESGIVYRPTRIAPIDRALLDMRRRSGVTYIPAEAQALFTILQMLRRDAAIGILVDEHFPRGIDVTFFGRPCKTTPLFARYARQLDCPIRGGRLIRLPDGRFRFDITEALATPRDASGRIDVAATTQAITSIIEVWVREYPEQWLWLQRRWR